MIFYKDKHQIDLVADHMDVVVQCIKTAGGAVEAYIDNSLADATDLALQADALDLDANHKMEKILTRISGTGVLAPIREDLFLLSSGLNRVADCAAACGLFFLDRRPEIPHTLRATFKKYAAVAFSGQVEMKNEALNCLKGGWRRNKAGEAVRILGRVRIELQKIRRDLNRQIAEEIDITRPRITIDTSIAQVTAVFDRMVIVAERITRINLRHGI